MKFLEDDFGGELDLAAGVGGGRDGSGGAESCGGVLVGECALGGAGGVDDLVGELQVGVVEDVEELGAELETGALGELGGLEQREVPVCKAGAGE